MSWEFRMRILIEYIGCYRKFPHGVPYEMPFAASIILHSEFLIFMMMTGRKLALMGNSLYI